LRGVLSSTWLERLSDAIERDIANPGPHFHRYVPEDGKGHFHGTLKLWQSDPYFRALCLVSGLPGIAQKLFNSTKVNLLYDQLFVKEPGTVNRTRWHNDQPYWPVTGDQVASFWFSLDTVNAGTGALEFVRGSHKWDRWFQPENFGPGAKGKQSGYELNPDYEKMPDVEADRAAYDIVTWDLETGDIYVFHALTINGAGGNQRGDRRRRGYTVRYTGDDAVHDERPGTSVPLHDATKKTGEPMDGDQFPRIIGT
jgi:ectoine hydroxylase-related dioxygenase (phytanoyl-CoA dioxygenase family)